MKIFFILCHPSLSLEPEIREGELAFALRQHGHDARIFRISNTKEVTECRYKNSVPVFYYPIDDLAKQFPEYTSKVLATALADDAPDILILKGVNYWLAPFILARINHNHIKVGFIVGGASTHPFLYQADFVMAESQMQAASISEFLARDIPIQILPKYVDWQAVRALPETPKIFDIINVGTFDVRKNQIDLRPFFTQYRIAMIGAGPTLNFVKSAAGGRPNVSFFGHLPYKQVLKVASLTKIMVHTSSSEGFPRVFIEALACGVPVIALRKGIQADFPDTDSVTLIDHDDLVSVVDDVLRSDERLSRMARDASRYALAHHGPDSLKKSVEFLLRTLNQC